MADPPAGKSPYSARYRRIVDRVAIGVAIGVGVVGLVVIGIFDVFDEDETRDSTVTVTETREVVESGPSPGVTTTTTEEEVTPATDTSALSQLFSSPGSAFLLNVGLIAFAAFIAGALVQRVALGEFALTVGPIELPAIPREVAEDAVGLITSAPQIAPIVTKGRGMTPYPDFLSINDPRLQFLSIRIELEKRLRNLAPPAEINRQLNLDMLLERLRTDQVIDGQAVAGLSELLRLGDQAAAGAEVSSETLAAIKESAWDVLSALFLLEQELVAKYLERHPDPPTSL